MSHLLHRVYDTDKHFKVDKNTRTLSTDNSQKNILVQYDHNSERFTFELPRFIDGHDMSTCNVVQVHYINIDAQTSDASSDLYEVDDLQISPDSEDVVIFSWLIHRNATKYVGSLKFVLRLACVEDDEICYDWHTTVCQLIFVSDGLNNAPAVVEENLEVLEAWRTEIFGAIERANSAVGPQGPQGVSGVYVGSGEMPEGYNVQIDPDGEADEGTAQWAVEQAKAYTDEVIKAMREEDHPIGSLYITNDPGDYSALYGFVWERLAAGTTIVSADPDSFDGDFIEADKTGGEKTHLLTVEELASHNHPIGLNYGDNANFPANLGNAGLDWTEASSIKNWDYYEGVDMSGYAGGGQPHNNMPPYITKYIWQRTA